MISRAHVAALLLPAFGLAGCMAPDRWILGYTREPARGNLPPRDLLNISLSGPIPSLHPHDSPVLRATPVDP